MHKRCEKLMDKFTISFRWGQGTGQKHGSYFSGPDRWQPGHLIDHKWENAMTIDKQSWGIRRNMDIADILTPEELISEVIKTFLINFFYDL